jgi:hypothetical protein
MPRKKPVRRICNIYCQISESRHSAIHPEIPQRGIEGLVTKRRDHASY